MPSEPPGPIALLSEVLAAELTWLSPAPDDADTFVALSLG
jgi:hypothetical protein